MSKKPTAEELMDAIAFAKLDLGATDRFKTPAQMADRERFKADERAELARLEAQLNKLSPHR